MSKFNILETIKEISKMGREIAVRMKSLTFSDNFESFEVDIDILANSERANIPNSLKLIPKRYIIVSQVGDGLITKGDTAWNINYISFKNNGSNNVTAKIIVLR